MRDENNITRERGRDRELFTFLFLFLLTLFFGEAGTGSDQEQCDRARGIDGWRIGERGEEEEEGTRDGGLPRRPSPSLPWWLLSGACPGLASGWFYLLAPLRPFPLSFVCAPSTTTARQLECKHLPSPCLLFLPSLHICTCKGLLRLIWRLAGWRPCVLP